MTLGELIKKYREDNHISQRKFAILAGITNSYVSCLEMNENTSSGKPPAPTVSVLEGCAKAMNMSFDELVYRLGNEQLISLTRNDTTADLDDEAKELLFAFRKLNDFGKKAIMAEMNALSKMDEFKA